MTNEFTKIAYIYALAEPDTMRVRYIGKSISPRERLKAHMYPKEMSRRVKGKWITQLRSEGKFPKLLIIEVCEHSNWENREIHWINHYRSIYNDLLNGTGGGAGGSLSTEESKALQSLRLRGKPKPKFSEEHLKRLTEHNQRRAKDPDFITMRKQKQSQLWADPEYRTRMLKSHECRKSPSNVKTWEVINPLGEVTIVTNLTAYFENTGISPTSVRRAGVRGSKTKSGWSCRLIT